jgi:uncharacterized protein YkwD
MDQSSALTWDDNLAATSRQWAQNLAQRNTLEHSTFGNGENLYIAWGGDKSCRAAVDAWYDEKKNYRPGTKIGEGDFSGYGHYTQVRFYIDKRECDSSLNLNC